MHRNISLDFTEQILLREGIGVKEPRGDKRSKTQALSHLNWGGFRIRGDLFLRFFALYTNGQVFEHKIITHNVLNKKASCSYPTFAFHRQAFEIFEIHICVFVALISPLLRTKKSMIW